MLYELPQLRSIKVVYLEINSLTEDQFFHWIPPLLPDLEQLTLKCDYDFEVQDDKNENQEMGRFKTRIRQEFHQLRALKLIVVN